MKAFRAAVFRFHRLRPDDATSDAEALRVLRPTCQMPHPTRQPSGHRCPRVAVFRMADGTRYCGRCVGADVLAFPLTLTDCRDLLEQYLAWGHDLATHGRETARDARRVDPETAVYMGRRARALARDGRSAVRRAQYWLRRAEAAVSA